MTEKYQTGAYFWVQGFDGPYSEITELMGIEPTKAGLKGDPGKHISAIKESFWQVDSPLADTEIFIDAHIKELWDAID